MIRRASAVQLLRLDHMSGHTNDTNFLQSGGLNDLIFHPSVVDH